MPVLQPERLTRELFERTFAALDADLGVVAAYGKILPEWLLDAPRLGMVNVHASLLPRYRGAAPVHRAVMDGETETGVTIMRVVKALDAGPMLARARRVRSAWTRRATSSSAIWRHSAPTCSLRPRRPRGRPARGSPAGRCGGDLRAAADQRGRADRLPPAGARHPQSRARTAAVASAYTFLDGGASFTVRAVFVSGHSRGTPGTCVTDVVDAHGRAAVMATRLTSCELQPEGGRVMSARDFLAGRLPGSASAQLRLAAPVIAPARRAGIPRLAGGPLAPHRPRRSA